MTDQIRWGILSTGNIATSFTTALSSLDDAVVTAVGSRTQASADRFGEQFGIPNRYGSYEALVKDESVDVIYIGSPHALHYEHALLALNAGKHVLCEKAFTLNTREAEEVINLATQKNLFLMEAMWMYFIPGVLAAKDLLVSGEIGQPRFLSAEFGIAPPYSPEGRLFNPQLGGGALLDVGIYPLSLALLMFGEPDAMYSHATLGETGVDESHSIILKYDDGRIAMLGSSVRTDMPNHAYISGDKGHMRLHREFWNTRQVSLSFPDKADITREYPVMTNGLEYEAMEVMNCLRAGKTQSEVVPHSHTLMVMQLMDELREGWGVRYPTEKTSLF